MTSPNQQDQGQQQPARKLRAGQLVSFRHPDVHAVSGVIEGHGIVLAVTEDGSAATIAPLSLLHLYTAADNVTPAKAEDVQTSIAQPETTETTS